MQTPKTSFPAILCWLIAFDVARSIYLFWDTIEAESGWVPWIMAGNGLLYLMVGIGLWLEVGIARVILRILAVWLAVQLAAYALGGTEIRIRFAAKAIAVCWAAWEVRYHRDVASERNTSTE